MRLKVTTLLKLTMVKRFLQKNVYHALAGNLNAIIVTTTMSYRLDTNVRCAKAQDIEVN